VPGARRAAVPVRTHRQQAIAELNDHMLAKRRAPAPAVEHRLSL
jgi:hypothetical protein